MEKEELIEKAKEFLARPTELTLKRYKEIRKEWNEITSKRDKGEISPEETFKTHKKLMEETEKIEIKFDEEKDFTDFSFLFGSFVGIPTEHIKEQVKHEIEHTKPYKKVGIKSYLGWHNFLESAPNLFLIGRRFQAFHKPFGEKYDNLSSFEKDVLLYKSLHTTSKPSEGDLEAIKELEERHGNKIKQSPESDSEDKIN